jgi:citrate lyase subunit beta/citryl-CoA lyase
VTAPEGGTSTVKPLRTLALCYRECDDLAVMRADLDLGADAVAFDLEDHVPHPKLPLAREHIRTVLDEFGEDHTIFVRVNEVDNEQVLLDLDAIVCAGLHTVQLAKCGGPEDVLVLDALLELFEKRAGIEPGRIRIQPLLEGARSTVLAFDVARASPRVAYLGGWATRNGDPAIDIGYKWTPTMLETLFIRQKVLLDARAAGVPYPMGGLWNPWDDLDGLRRFAEQTFGVGYDGMCVLPVRTHVEIVNAVFTPSQDEVDYWSEVIPLIDEAQTDVVFRGESLPPNKAKWGRLRLALAAQYGVRPGG